MQKYVGCNVLECETVLFLRLLFNDILGSFEVERENVHSHFTGFRM
jgi:hypothetical protein